MLRSLKSVRGFTIQATDGAIGKVHTFFFDENSWEIRYLAVDPGTRFSGREHHILIAPVAFGTPIWDAQQFPVLLTRAQAASCPTSETGQPEHEHLHSTREVKGCHIQALDGEIGYLEDFIVDDQRWAIHYVVVKTIHWQAGREVLIAPEWITEVRWNERNVYIDLSQDRVKQSPEYRPADPVNREYEIQLYDFYGRPKPKSWSEQG